MAASTSVTIPTELLEQVERGNVLLFIGERLSRDSAGEALLDHLTAELAERAGLTDASALTFPEIAQAYQDDRGRQALVDFVSRRIAELGDEPQPVHRLIARLTQCNVLVTTTLSGRLERAFREAGRKLQVVIRNEDIAFEDEQVAQLYKLRGSLDQRDSLILTEDDNEQFFNDQDSISVLLQGYFARKTILFIGYSLEDDHFKRLYGKITASLDPYSRRSYAFGETPPPNVARWCKRKGIDVVEVNTTDFLQALTDQLAARARPTPLAVVATEQAAASLPEQPYKLLDYYEADDAAIYFGREREILELSSQIVAHRLTLLYGASGVGKTSLLLAGAAPRLTQQDQPYETIYARALEDPAQVIRRAVSRRLPDAALPQNGALVDFLAAATRALGRPMVLMLDQFEEFFIRLSPQFRAAFTVELGAICDARDLPIKIVLSLREDWLASVNELEQRIPEVFRNRIRVLPLFREQARQSITAPVERLGVHYEPALVERLLDDLAGSASAEIMPPQLQLVCSALYRRLAPGQHMIVLTNYEQIGGARGVLQQYLDDELARLNRDDRALARSALAELVTSQGTKAVRTADELALALGAARETLAPVLELLVRARLLRVIEREDGAPSYELAHEYLIREIELEADAKTRKQAEELIRQEVENWQRFGTLLAADKLALINDVRAVLRLGPEAQELLLRSALEVGDEVEYWLGRMDDPAQRARVLADKARTRVAAVRLRTASVLGTQDVPESVEPLLGLALHDPDYAVRDAARASLAKLTAQRPAIVERLQIAAQSKQREERAAALRTLARLPLRELPAGLRWPVLATQTQLGAVWLVATPKRRAVTLPVVAIVAAVLLVYAFAVNCYYIDTAQPFLANTFIEVDASNDVVIRHGLPWLSLPGLNQIVAHTGIPISRVPFHQRQELQRARLWGIVWLRGNRPYEKWGKDLAVAAYLEDGLPILWYLNPDEGLKAVLETTRSSDAMSRRWSAYALEQIVGVRPSAEPQAIEELTRLLDDPDDRVRIYAAAALSQMPHVPPAALDRSAEIVMSLVNNNDPFIKPSAADAVGLLALARPDTIPASITQLTSLLNWGGSVRERVRERAIASLRRIVRNSPEYADQVFVLLQKQGAAYIVSDDDMAALLGDIGAADPEITPKLVASLTPELDSGDYNVRDAAMTALPKVIRANPAIAAQIIEHLSPQRHTGGAFLSGGDTIGTGIIVRGLAGVANAHPSSAPQIARLLISVVDTYMDDNILWGLGQVGASNPTAAQLVVPTLESSLQYYNPWTRMAGVTALGKIPGVPSAIIQKVTEAAINLLNDKSGDVRSAAGRAVASIAVSNQAIATRVVEPLTLLLDDSRVDVRTDAAIALARLQETDQSAVPQQIASKLYNILNSYDMDQYNKFLNDTDAGSSLRRELPPNQSEEALLAALNNPLNSHDRPLAAYALFEIALRDPSRAQSLRAQLEPLASGTQPVARLWANATLHLIDIADLAHHANDTPAERGALIRELTQRSIPSAAQGPSRPFFFADTAAAQEALDWLHEQENHPTGDTP